MDQELNPQPISTKDPTGGVGSSNLEVPTWNPQGGLQCKSCERCFDSCSLHYWLCYLYLAFPLCCCSEVKDGRRTTTTEMRYTKPPCQQKVKMRKKSLGCTAEEALLVEVNFYVTDLLISPVYTQLVLKLLCFSIAFAFLYTRLESEISPLNLPFIA